MDINVISWNLLAAAYAHCSWSKRCHLITSFLTELQGNEVLLLQEVDHYADFYLPMLTSLGYECKYKQRPDKKDGCLLCYKRDVFNLLDLEEVSYDDISQSSLDISDSIRRGFMRQNVGIIAQLEYTSRSTKERQQVTVAVTHLYWNPRFPEVKCAQAMYLLSKLQLFAYRHRRTDGSNDSNSCERKSVCDVDSNSFWPVILGGDFNSVPSSRQVAILTAQELPAGVQAAMLAMVEADAGSEPAGSDPVDAAERVGAAAAVQADSKAANPLEVALIDAIIIAVYTCEGGETGAGGSGADDKNSILREISGFGSYFGGGAVKFLCDANLSKLCRWLRVLGVDTAIEFIPDVPADEAAAAAASVSSGVAVGKGSNATKSSGKQAVGTGPGPGTGGGIGADYSMLFAQAREERRVILTASKNMRSRAACPESMLIDTKDLESSLVEVFRMYKIPLKRSNFLTVCGKCGGGIINVTPEEYKQTILDRVGEDAVAAQLASQNEDSLVYTPPCTHKYRAIRRHPVQMLKFVPSDRPVYMCQLCTQPYWWNESETSPPAKAMYLADRLYRRILHDLVDADGATPEDEEDEENEDEEQEKEQDGEGERDANVATTTPSTDEITGEASNNGSCDSNSATVNTAADTAAQRAASKKKRAEAKRKNAPASNRFRGDGRDSCQYTLRQMFEQRDLTVVKSAANSRNTSAAVSRSVSSSEANGTTSKVAGDHAAPSSSSAAVVAAATPGVPSDLTTSAAATDASDVPAGVINSRKWPHLTLRSVFSSSIGRGHGGSSPSISDGMGAMSLGDGAATAASEAVDEPSYTNWTDSFRGTLDFIFVSSAESGTALAPAVSRGSASTHVLHACTIPHAHLREEDTEENASAHCDNGHDGQVSVGRTAHSSHTSLNSETFCDLAVLCKPSSSRNAVGTSPCPLLNSDANGHSEGQQQLCPRLQVATSAVGPFPSAVFPSDHIILHASLRI